MEWCRLVVGEVLQRDACTYYQQTTPVSKVQTIYLIKKKQARKHNTYTNAFSVCRVKVDIRRHRPHQVETDLLAIAARNLQTRITRLQTAP